MSRSKRDRIARLPGSLYRVFIYLQDFQITTFLNLSILELQLCVLHLKRVSITLFFLHNNMWSPHLACLSPTVHKQNNNETRKKTRPHYPDYKMCYDIITHAQSKPAVNRVLHVILWELFHSCHRALIKPVLMFFQCEISFRFTPKHELDVFPWVCCFWL